MQTLELGWDRISINAEERSGDFRVLIAKARLNLSPSIRTLNQPLVVPCVGFIERTVNLFSHSNTCRMAQQYYEYVNYKEDHVQEQKKLPKGACHKYIIVFQSVFYIVFHVSLESFRVFVPRLTSGNEFARQ